MAKPSNDPSNYQAFAVQSAKDVAGTTFFFTRHLEGSGAEIEQEIQSEREGGDGQEVGLRYKSKVAFDGAAAVNARPQVAGRLAAWTLGQDTPSLIASDAGGNVYEHTAAPAASLPYITAEQRAPEDLIERSTNNVFTGFSEEWEAGRPLKITANFVSGGSVARRLVGSALSVTRETPKPFIYPGASVALAISDGAGGEATAIVVTKGKLEVRRGVDEDIQTTGLNREDALPLSFDVESELTIRYENLALYRNALYGSGVNLQTDLATGTLNLFSARGSFSHRLNVPLMEITGVKLNRLDPDGKTVYLDVTAESIKHASHAVFAVTRTSEASGYLAA